MPGDARRYSWAPFEPGHTLTLRHGASSPRVIQPLADELAAAMVVAAPWLRAVAFAPAVADWSHAEARSAVLRLEVDRLWSGLPEEPGEGRDAAEAALQVAERRLDLAVARAGRLRRDLGLTPKAWAQVLAASKIAEAAGVEGAAEQVEALAAVGRELTERAGRALGPGSDEEASDGEA